MTVNDVSKPYPATSAVNHTNELPTSSVSTTLLVPPVACTGPVSSVPCRACV